MSLRKRPYLFDPFALQTILKIYSVELLTGAYGISYGTSSRDKRAFFWPVLLSEIFHASKIGVFINTDATALSRGIGAGHVLDYFNPNSFLIFGT